MANKGIVAEWELDRILTERAYHVQRMAASHGLYDLQVDDYRSRTQYRVEVKTTGQKAFYPKPDSRKAIHMLVVSCQRMRCVPLLAVRFAGNHGAQAAEWEIFDAKVVLDDVARRGEGKPVELYFPRVDGG